MHCYRADSVHKAFARSATKGLVSARFTNTEIRCRFARPYAGVLDRGAAEPVTVLDEHASVRQEIERVVDADGVEVHAEIGFRDMIGNCKWAAGVRDRRSDNAKRGAVIPDLGNDAFAHPDVAVKPRVGDRDGAAGIHNEHGRIIGTGTYTTQNIAIGDLERAL